MEQKRLCEEGELRSAIVNGEYVRRRQAEADKVLSLLQGYNAEDVEVVLRHALFMLKDFCRKQVYVRDDS